MRILGNRILRCHSRDIIYYVESIGERIKTEIGKQRRSIKSVAHEAGISREGLSKIIRGLVEPRRDTLERIAQALDIDVDVLLQGPGEEEEMGRAVPGAKSYPVGSKYIGTLGREKIDVLRTALAIICQLAQRGEASPELREEITALITRLEDQ